MGKSILRKLNCWEFKLCERQPGGLKEKELGTCSAALETKSNKVNGGVNGGRYCWKVKDSLCEFQLHGTFALEQDICKNCDFYKLVQTEEGACFME